VNEFITAYLRCLHMLRGGKLSASAAMSAVMDMAAAAQNAKAGIGQVVGAASALLAQRDPERGAHV
jgi:hypothetical protein